ncbi:hypothetical protein BDP27DRAFT_436815 [Rhodocollybia butyracea]|uniref:Uncharacterized protein n=1 Tax=Rhodocollybia butyracea TaxID=206335 RepID=A0A9P5PA28_9AGAR|nr:hypothetical protein BDP27DRAFT_436815 [Rhodocollybia butyracea]
MHPISAPYLSFSLLLCLSPAFVLRAPSATFILSLYGLLSLVASRQCYYYSFLKRGQRAFSKFEAKSLPTSSSSTYGTHFSRLNVQQFALVHIYRPDRLP